MTSFKSPALKGATSVSFTNPRPAKPTGILHFTIGVTDLARSRQFYEEIVGATFIRQNDSTVFMRCGDQVFVLSRSGYHSAPNRGNDTLIHHAFIIPSDEFDANMSYLEARGVTVLVYEDQGHRTFAGRHAYFHDPDGNTIEFIDWTGGGDSAAPDYESRARRTKTRAEPPGAS